MHPWFTNFKKGFHGSHGICFYSLRDWRPFLTKCDEGIGLMSHG